MKRKQRLRKIVNFHSTVDIVAHIVWILIVVAACYWFSAHTAAFLIGAVAATCHFWFLHYNHQKYKNRINQAIMEDKENNQS